MANGIKVTDDTFQKEVMEADQPVLVDFWASWCGPCKMVAPIVEKIAEEFEGKAKIGKFNVENNKEIPTQYKISGIPTLMIFNEGELVEKFVGVRPYDDLASALKKYTE